MVSRVPEKSMTVLDDLERLEQEATPGSWSPGTYEGIPRIFWDRGNGTVAIATVHDLVSIGKPDANAAFLAAARNYLPVLIDIARTAKALAYEIGLTYRGARKHDRCREGAPKRPRQVGGREMSHVLDVVKPKCKHTPCPTGYVEWHFWAEKKTRTHEQERCPGCGRWAIWKRKKRDDA